MKKLILTLQFLTILPLGKSVDFQPVKMISFFPVAGLVIGIILALADQIFLLLWSPNVAALLDVVMLVLITGALHIDGLGDAADGILGHRPREKALLIMKDSRIGVMGLVCILCGLSIKWAGIAGIDAHRSLLLIIIPAYARGGMIFGIKFLKYGRPEGGTGHSLFESPLPITAFSGLLIPLFLSFFLGVAGIWLNILFLTFTSALLYFFHKRMGCITGDMLGTMTEITESLLFLMMSMRMVT